MENKRPIGVTILAVLAGLAAIVAIIHTLQMLHLWPIWLGPVRFFTFNLIGAILWGLMAAIWIWLVRGLWKVDPSAWMFMVVLSSLNLMLALLSLLGESTAAGLAPTILINSVILIYAMLPKTQKAFGR